MGPCASRGLIPVLLGCALAGCANHAAHEDAAPPLVFVRSRAVFTPEQRNRDVAECIDLVHPELAADAGLWDAPPGAARAALRERLVTCMDERGWTTGAVTRPEEWAE